METHLAIYRAKSGGKDRYADFLSWLSEGRVNGWSATKSFKPGDLVLFYFANPLESIAAVGIVESEPWEESGKFDWRTKRKATFCDYSPVWFLEKPLSLARAASKLGVIPWYKTQPYRSTRKIPPEVASVLLAEIVATNSEVADGLRKIRRIPKRSREHLPPKQNYEEGATREITRELRFRDSRLKKAAILIRGCKCEICGFEFEESYGELGSGYIEIHHLRPLSKAKKSRPTSIEEVALVCANCHRVLHRHGAKPIPLEQLRRVVQHR